MQIESYRARLENFEQNLNGELYRYHSGLKNQLELTSVYSEYSDLFSRESIHEIKSALDNADGAFPSRQKSLKKIHEYLIDQHLDFRAAPLTQEIAQFDAHHKLVWEGKEIFFSQIPSMLKDESNAAKRRQLSEKYARGIRDSADLRRRKLALRQTTAENLGFRDYVEAREYIAGVNYAELLKALDTVVSRSDDSYFERLRFSVEATLGLSLQDAGS